MLCHSSTVKIPEQSLPSFHFSESSYALYYVCQGFLVAGRAWMEWDYSLFPRTESPLLHFALIPTLSSISQLRLASTVGSQQMLTDLASYLLCVLLISQLWWQPRYVRIPLMTSCRSPDHVWNSSTHKDMARQLCLGLARYLEFCS